MILLLPENREGGKHKGDHAIQISHIQSLLQGLYYLVE